MRIPALAAALLLAGCSQATADLPEDLEMAETAGAVAEATAENDAVPDAELAEVEESSLSSDALDSRGYALLDGSYIRDNGSSYESDEEVAEYTEPKRFDEDTAAYDAKREAYRRGYRGFCTDDCSGHEAGFNWAYENRLSRPSPTFDSPSFDEGQSAFFKDVERRVEEKRQEFEMDPGSSEYADE